MKKYYISVLLFLFIAFRLFAQIPKQPPIYECNHVEAKEIIIDGKLDEDAWDKAFWTNDFQDIQGDDFRQPYLATRAKLLWTDSLLIIGAYLQQPHIWAYINDDEKVMYFDDDFEVFIDPDGDHHHYFEFEFNALNKKWDLFLQHPYRDIVKPDSKWDCKGLQHQTKIYGTINDVSGGQDSAWTIEIAIPIHELYSKVESGDVWRVNFSRVEWETDIVNGQYLKLEEPENNWVWSPTWAINMHRPEYWGYLHFVKDYKSQPLKGNSLLWESQVQLMQAYEIRRNYWRKHRIYPPWNLDNSEYIQLEEFGYEYILSKKVGEDIWKVNEMGRLWKEKYQLTPKFWIWMGAHHINSLSQWDSVFQDIHSLGIRGVLLSASSEKIRQILPIAQKYDLQIHIWMWAMNRGDAPKEYLSVNDLNKSLAEEKAYVDYYKFICPALPEVKDFINKKVLDLERIDGISGIHLDYIRYVDVFLPKGLLPKYILIQDDILPEFDYGYHPYMLEKFKKEFGYSPREMVDYPNDSLWQQFRMDQVSFIVNDLADQYASKELKLSAAVFPDPEMSRKMVRQDWGNWKLDYYFPMVYNGFYLEGMDWIEERIKISKKYHPNTPVFCGLYLPDSKTKEELLESMRAAFRGGTTGISFFDYWGMKEYHKEAIREMVDEKGEFINRDEVNIKK